MRKTKLFKNILILLFFCATLLSGCGSVTFSMIQYSTGQVLQTFSVFLDKEKITEGGYDYNVSINKIVTVLENVFLKQKQRFYALEDYSSSVKDQVINNDLKTKIFIKDNVVYAQMLFENLTSYKYFYNINTSEQDNSSITKEFAFYKKVYTASYTKFYNYLDDDIYNDAVNEMQAYFSDIGHQVFSVNDLNYNYCYAVNSNYHLHSNADYVYSQNGLDFHIWNLRADNLDKIIIFYQIVAKPLLWYVVAVALTILLVIVLLIISKIKSKKIKDEQTSQETLQNFKSETLCEIYKKIEEGNITQSNFLNTEQESEDKKDENN